MSWQRQATFWLISAAVLIFLMWLLSDVLLPFILAFIIAYFLDPVTNRLERLGMPRWVAVSLIMLVFLLLITLAVLILVPMLSGQFAALRTNLPNYARALQGIIARLNDTVLGGLIGDHLPEIQKALTDSLGQGASFAATFVNSLWTSGLAVVNIISILVITPVVTFYLLLDWDRMLGRIDSWLPREHAGTIRAICRDINTAISGFLRGQAAVCILLGLFYGIALTIAGVSFGFLIGMASGFASFIPYVGAILGFITAVTVALVQDWPSIQLALIAGAIYMVGQFIEGNILSPRLVGESVGLHPVWMIFALLAFGTLFGFVGLLVAVPVSAAIGVLCRYALAKYLASPLFRGEDAPVVARVNREP